MSKRGFYILLLVVIIAILLFTVAIKFVQQENEEELQTEEFVEYIPQEEISEEQERQTIITLYYKNKETGELQPEARMVDVKELMENPYKTILELLLEGPKNEKLETCMPEGTKLNKIFVEEGIVTIDLSSEFITGANKGKEEELKIVNSIVLTLGELMEVENIKILIDGKENQEFEDKEINFKEVFSIF